MGMRPYWADYANHMLRFYVRNDDPAMIYQFKSRSDEKNWRACQRVVEQISRREKEIIKAVYGGTMFLEDAVNAYLEARPKENSNAVWDVVYTVSKRVAQMRGLL